VTASAAPGSDRRRNGSGRASGRRAAASARSGGGDAAAGANLTEVFGGREYFLFGGGDVFTSTGNDKDWFIAARRSLDVCVGLGSQRFDLAAYVTTKRYSTYHITAVYK